MTTLPALTEIRASASGPQSPLADALQILFEHSPILVNALEPQLNAVLKSLPPFDSYEHLIDVALTELAKWDIGAQSEFISGHPRIGESTNLSKLSASEQGAQGVSPTPPEVMARLAHLNACYEVKYPGLRYITFVNGRSRAAIAEEMEDALNIPRLSLPTEPRRDRIAPVEVGGKSGEPSWTELCMTLGVSRRVGWEVWE